MEKRDWKRRAKRAEARAQEAEERAQEVEERAHALAGEVRELRREVEDKRKNWAPIKITHPWTPRDSACRFCDDPREDPRHVG